MKRLLQHFAMLSIVCFLSFMFIYSAYNYNIRASNLLNALCYLGFFILLPIVVILIGRKYRILRSYATCAMGLVILITVVMYYMNAETVTHDLADYLMGDSEFVQIAADILPAKDEVESTSTFTYCHRKNNAGFEMVELHISYDHETFSNVISDTESNYVRLQNKFTGEPEDVFIDGHIFSCILIQTQTGYYAVAYHVCSDCHSVSWLIFTTEQLSYVSISDAWAYCQ